MKVLKTHEAVEWCTRRGLMVNESVPSAGAELSAGQTWRLRLRVPASPAERIAMANVLVAPSVLDTGVENYGGGLFWLRDWDIWSNTIERVGIRIFEGLFGVTDSDRTARVFAPDELVSAQTAVSVALLFEWSAFVAPNGPGPAFVISHHGNVEMIVRSEDEQRRLRRRFPETWTEGILLSP